MNKWEKLRAVVQARLHDGWTSDQWILDLMDRLDAEEAKPCPTCGGTRRVFTPTVRHVDGHAVCGDDIFPALCTAFGVKP